MKRNIISLAIGVLISIPLMVAAVNIWTAPEMEKRIIIREYPIEEKKDIETEVFGADPETDFVPGYYEFDPYPDAIEKHIEATAYCHGEITKSGKKVRAGMAAMSERYLGMTAVVYEADENGQPSEYIGTYEIEDTGGDYRIRNGNCIDIYIPDHEKAMEFGRKQVVVYLLEAKG